MYEMKIKIEECLIQLDDTQAICTAVLSVEFDNDDFIYHIEGIEHGNDENDDLMILDKKFMSKAFISEVAKIIDGPKIQEYLREATQEEYRNLLEDLDLSDYSENYEDNSYV